MTTKTKILLLASITLALVAYFFVAKNSAQHQQTNNLPPTPKQTAPVSASNVTDKAPKPLNNTHTDTTNQPLKELYFPEVELHGGLAKHIDELREKYNQGDLEAGFILARGLERCMGAITTKEELERSFQNLESVQKSQFFDDERMAQEKERLSQLFDFCEGMPKVDVWDHFEVLQTTALRGSIAAQTDFVHSIFPTDVEKDGHLYTPEERAQLIEIKNNYDHFIENAAHHGSMRAISTMVMINMPHTRNDLVKALAYNFAFLELTRNDNYYQIHQEKEQELINQMSQQDVEKARERSQEIIEIINKNGSIYRIQ